MRKSTISVCDFFKMLLDDEAANDWFARIVYFKGDPYCLHCGVTEKVYRSKGGRRYRCGHCKKDSNITSGTLMQGSPIPIRKWIFAVYCVMTARKGVPSLQLSKEIGVTQKTAWFMLQRMPFDRLESCSNALLERSLPIRN